ncbi:hypothetical protein AUR64_03185 [Haloprofundus marisrubri]|uniref:DUF3179 domain-containing protein n=1 Tax=Haloprofundus marisrubri TaxID=1514971 RepID=A0A0W1RDP8_9EURY|nr:DUF3179 domain-containing protein [Haloprofundus marisrubri]KTG11522.1 hypothetical protein AUR64_03185 [Haloprofundus marisrubri]
MSSTRRDVLRWTGGLGLAALGGCLGSAHRDDASADRSVSSDDESLPPTTERPLYLGHGLESLRNNVVSGGVSKDGIPSIDRPVFSAADASSLGDGDPVFGLVRNGDARAYPQRVLVWHEIVNDSVGGDPVAVTYCPLTGTAQGFERGPAEFGVSGRLVNSNLVMYDRATDSRWPQMLATAIEGALEGESLHEFRLVWTTWKNWRDAYPNTRVLTEQTGYSRRYGDDPYGRYNPDSGYYANTQLLFDPLSEDTRANPKTVVLGVRTAHGALAFEKTSLLENRVLEGELAGERFVAVADPALETGYVYVADADVDVEPNAAGYDVDGEFARANELPLGRSLAFDAMWFAWAGFYPETNYVV